MNQFSPTQRRRILFIVLILSLAGAGGTVASQFVFRAKAQQIRTSNVSNVVRGYLAVSVGDAGAVVTAVGPGKTAASFSRSTASGVVPKDVYLPGVTVFLEDPQTQRRSKEVRTDLSGRFTLYAPEPSRYRLCWKSEVYDNGCTEVFVSTGSSPQFVSTVTIPVPARRDFVAVTGHVTAADGSSVRSFDPMLNINAFATVGLEDAKANRLVTVYVNNFGDYLLPYVPINGKYNLSANIESAKYTQEIRTDTKTQTTRPNRINLKIGNSPPKLDPLIVGDSSNRRVQNATLGSEINVAVNARDDDGDVVSYSWFVDSSAGQLSQTTGSAVKWRLPQTPGLYTVTAVASDRKGGYDKAVTTVRVGAKGIPFSGTVVELDGTPVDQAEIEIIGNPIIKTGAKGRFSTYVTEADRYVLNVRKQGYALNSQIYDRALTSGRWILRRAKSVMIDPTRDQVVTSTRTQADCPGPDSIRAGLGAAGDSLKNPRWQDGKGHAIDPPSTYCRTCSGPKGAETELFVTKPGGQPIVMPRDLKIPKCGPGASVHFPANSILDVNGNPVTAPFEVAIATVDLLSPQQMPGDYSVLPTGRIESFGAGSLDLPAGFKISSSANVTVTIPVDRSRLMGETLPASVPLLSYDETKGLWNQDGTLDLKTVNHVKSYVGQVKHFSPFNADNVKTTDSACIRLFNDDMPTDYELEVSSPLGGTGAPRIVRHPIHNSGPLDESVIYNLPNNTNVTLAPMTLPSTPGANDQQLLGFYVVNSGKAIPAAQNPSPLAPDGPPYLVCDNFVRLRAQNAPSSPFGGEFLHGLGFIDAANLGALELDPAVATSTSLRDRIVTASQSYYDHVDPEHLRTNFADFKIHNGFAPVAADGAANGEIIAQYANSGDLGFGRDMHCLKNTAGDVACYVTNYGFGYTAVAPLGDATDDQHDADAAGLRHTVVDSSEVATVAMEYSAIEDGSTEKVVKFFVYKAALTTIAATTLTNPSGGYARSISANLDGRGERPVPQLCMICHGGQIPAPSADGVPAFGTDQVNLHARFLPFDYRFFTFPETLPRSAQAHSIKRLNQEIVDAVPNPLPAGDPIHEVIQTLYANAASDDQTPDTTIPGWTTGALGNQNAFYQSVVANACRVCHTAQPFDQLQFNTSDKFVNLHVTGTLFPVTGGLNNSLMLGTAQMRVCGDYVMPHALRTHDIFWGTYATFPVPSMRSAFQTFGDDLATAGLLGNASIWQSGLCTSPITNGGSRPGEFFQHVIQPILNAKCVACHNPVGSAPFSLADGDSYHQLVELHRVAPPNDNPLAPGNTMLNLVTSTSTGAFDRMPLGCFRAPTESPHEDPVTHVTHNLPCLSQQDIDVIKAWIRSGAN